MPAGSHARTDPVEGSLVQRYLELGLALGRHVEGVVDAYYGPVELSERVGKEPLRSPRELVEAARQLLAATQAREPLGELAAGGSPAISTLGPSSAGPVSQPGTMHEEGAEARRYHWLAAQVRGIWMTARRLAGEPVGYSDEVEACYGVRPKRVPEEELEVAHNHLDEALPGSGALYERMLAWRDDHVVPPELLRGLLLSLTEELRERTAVLFGLPEGERVDFELVTGQPWSGFNYYLGDLHSRVAVNVDLPVLSSSIAHLVAHEAYPGHHTEHTHKEVGLVRARRFWEETIFLVGTPQCLIAEGLADLGLEIVAGRRPESMVAEHMRAQKISYDPEQVGAIAEASETLSYVRQNAALRLHEDRADPDVVASEVVRWGLLDERRARKLVEFLLHPTWRAYVTCYVEGLPLCRQWVQASPKRFERLLSEQMTPDQLKGAPKARSG